MCMRTACPKDKPEFNIFLLVVFMDLLGSTWMPVALLLFKKKNQHFFIIFIKQNCNE